MRYEVLIMLAVIGGLNLVGRLLAKRAAARQAQSQAAPPSAPAPQPVQRRVVRSQSPATALKPTRAATRPSQASPRAVAQAAPSVAKVVDATESMVHRPAAAPARPVGPTRSWAIAAGPTVREQAQRNRWNARSLRRALVASEILGTPVSLRA